MEGSEGYEEQLVYSKAARIDPRCRDLQRPASQRHNLASFANTCSWRRFDSRQSYVRITEGKGNSNVPHPHREVNRFSYPHSDTPSMRHVDVFQYLLLRQLRYHPSGSNDRRERCAGYRRNHRGEYRIVTQLLEWRIIEHVSDRTRGIENEG